MGTVREERWDNNVSTLQNPKGYYKKFIFHYEEGWSGQIGKTKRDRIIKYVFGTGSSYINIEGTTYEVTTKEFVEVDEIIQRAKRLMKDFGVKNISINLETHNNKRIFKDFSSHEKYAPWYFKPSMEHPNWRYDFDNLKDGMNMLVKAYSYFIRVGNGPVSRRGAYKEVENLLWALKNKYPDGDFESKQFYYELTKKANELLSFEDQSTGDMLEEYDKKRDKWKSLDSASLNPDSPQKGVLRPGDHLEVLNEHDFHFTDFSSSHSGGDKVTGRGRNEHITTMREGDYIRYIGPIQAGKKTLYKFIYCPQDKPEETTFYVEDAKKFLKGIGY